MYEHNALGFWSGLALCLTKVRSSRARCPATALIVVVFVIQISLNDITWSITEPRFFFNAKINHWEDKLFNSICFDA